MDHKGEIRGLLQGVEVAVLLEERFSIDFVAIGFDQEMIDSVNAIVRLVTHPSLTE